jgi:hypothetical protein
MQWAEGGSLDDFIDARMGRAPANHLTHLHSGTSESSEHSTPELASDPATYSRGARIRAFRAMQHAAPEERERLRRQMSGFGIHKGGGNKAEWKPVHLLSAEEVQSLFRDVVQGLAFLVRLWPFLRLMTVLIRSSLLSTINPSFTLTLNPVTYY